MLLYHCIKIPLDSQQVVSVDAVPKLGIVQYFLPSGEFSSESRWIPADASASLPGFFYLRTILVPHLDPADGLFSAVGGLRDAWIVEKGRESILIFTYPYQQVTQFIHLATFFMGLELCFRIEYLYANIFALLHN